VSTAPEQTKNAEEVQEEEAEEIGGLNSRMIRRIPSFFSVFVSLAGP
jgi:hypothetical protein